MRRRRIRTVVLRTRAQCMPLSLEALLRFDPQNSRNDQLTETYELNVTDDAKYKAPVIATMKMLT